MEFDSVPQFAEYMTLQRGMSPATIREYRYDLKHYAAWLCAAGKSLDDVGPQDVSEYVKYMRGKLGLQPKTCKRRIAAVSTFHKWRVRVGLSKNDPVYFIELPKAAARLPVYLTEEETAHFVQLLEREANRRDIIGVRDRALMFLMLYAGLRISEALAIKEAAVALQDGYPVRVSVVGKGDKERQVPLGTSVSRAVRAWMDVKKALREDDDLARKFTRKNRMELECDYLFPGQDGRPLNARTVQKKLESLRQEFGGKKVTPHKLRHSFATALLRKNVDIKTTQGLLGHASIATTQIYVHVEDAQQLDAVMRLG